jgi:hypothetical protein
METDPYSSSFFYVLLASGEYLIYEQKASVPYCKSIVLKRVLSIVIGKKIALPEYKQGDFYDIHAGKNFVFLQDNTKGLYILAHNVTGKNNLILICERGSIWRSRLS